jgi:uncharacterized membrane protein
MLGCAQRALPKGTMSHRVLGWSWVLLLMVIALSSFWINGLRQFGPFSLIHLLSIFTLIVLPIGVLHARRGRITRHRWTMISIFTGALVIAGIFTFVPGRVMHAVLFGQ